MPIPTYDELIFHLLQELAQHPEGLNTKAAADAVATTIALDEADLQQMLPSGRQSIYRNRIGWAHDRLKRARLSHSLKRGLWQLTERGFAYYQDNKEGLDEAQLKEFRALETKITASSANTPKPKSPPPSGKAPIPLDTGTTSTSSPEELIDAAVTELHDSLSRDLLELIKQSSPSFFERMVLDILVAMGYGFSRSDIQQTGKSGDGGIDGIIALDRLGLEKVYVQAKRWEGNVGSREIREFFGALAGRRAKKGVFLTTSSFTKEAKRYAEQVSDSLVLVDGTLLANLLIEYDVGVQVQRSIKVRHIDRDYFDEL